MHIESARALKIQMWEEARAAILEAEIPGPQFAVGLCPLADGTHGVAVRHSGESALVERLTSRTRELVGDACDIRDVGQIYSLEWQPDDLQARVRPLRPGLSLAHVDVTAGTLGAFVVPVDGGEGEIHVLSNNHVLANSDAGSPGDAVVQPGPADDGAMPDDQIGVLDRVVPLRRDESNVVDAATARVADGVEIDAGYPVGDLDGWGDVVEGAEVEKVGRTTGVTSGSVSAFEVDGLVIQYPDGPVEFHGQIEVSGDATGPFSEGGDSGSLVYRPDLREALGLLFAGSERGGPEGFGLTYCNPIGTVLEQLGVRFVSSS